ncbi:MAG TPA: hypothetical protein VF691_14660, partial [Cytophagaceae bacterium]
KSIYTLVRAEDAKVYFSDIDDKTTKYLDLHFLNKGISTTSFIKVDSTISSGSISDNFLVYKEKIIVIGACSFLYNKLLKEKISIDYLVANSKNHKEIGKLLNCFKPKLIIIDSSLKRYQSRKLQEQLASMKLKFVDISTSGGRVFDL